MAHLPLKKGSKEKILDEMRLARDKDVKWEDGRAFGLVYHVNKEIDDLLKDAFLMFFSENGLNPTAFPSLRKFETEVVSITANLLHGDENTVGNMTSGGTDSILNAMKAARDWARDHLPHITEPEILLPRSAHPAFEKAGHYFGLKTVFIPVRDDLRADVEAMRAAVTKNTIVMVGSAPAYPHGVVDPIRELAEIALEKGILFHTDSCVGGFMLPFVKKLGYPVPDFDFSVPGVTSMSADLHKFAYSAKGASVVLYESAELRRYQMFVSTEWSGGIYPSPSIAGTRPAGPIASAWAVLNYLGEEGYLQITDTLMKAVKKMHKAIDEMEGIKVLSDPEMSVFAIASDDPAIPIYEVADELHERGWHLDRQHFPKCLHVTTTYVHAGVADDFIADLAESVAEVRRPSVRKSASKWFISATDSLFRILPENWVTWIMSKFSALLGEGGGLPQRMAPMYGLIGTLPNRGDLKELVLDLLEGLTTEE